MPEEQFGASTTWTAPFAVTAVSYFVTGGGGGGYRDDDGEGSNGNGGGGGSGGYLIGSMNVTPGAQYSVVVGGGGAIGYYTQGGAGGASSFGGNQATGGNPGKDGAGGGGGAPNGVDGEEDKGQNTSATGKGGTSLDTPFGDGGNGNRNNKDNASAGNGGRVRISYTYNAPTITYFNGSTQTSSNGIPSNVGSLSWATTFANSVSISEVGGVAATGSTSVNTGLQSVAGSNSPASKTYTLTASGPGGTVTASATIYVYNDNTPSNSWSTSFSNLEPNTTVDLVLGTLSGVDMPTTISASGTGNFIGLGGSFSGSRNFNNGETVSLRTTTLPFNTDVSGKTGIYGKENSKTVTVSTPGGSFSVTVTTRAPRIREDFDYADNLDKYPYEDIDLIPNSPTEYLTTAQITANDIEIPMEIKVDKPDAQISINGSTWTNVRST